MISRDKIAGIIEEYDRLKLRIGMTASHSALDICDGAIEEGFPLSPIVKKVDTRHMQITSKPTEQILEELFVEWLTNLLL